MSLCGKKILLPVVVLSCWLCAGQLGSSQVPIHLGPGSDKPILSVDRSDCDRVDLTLSIRTLDNTVLDTKSGPFNLLSLADYGFTGDVGRPRLPAVREFVEIPHGADYDVVLYNATYGEISLAEMGIRNRIVPAQEPLPDQSGAEEQASFVLDQAVYESDNYTLDDTLRIVEEVIMRGRRLLVLEILPVDYRPKTGTLRVLLSGSIGISFSGGDRELTRSMLDRYGSASYDKVVHDVVLNGAAFENSVLGRGKRASRATGYLMIADPSFTGNASLQSLIGVRSAQDFVVTLVDTNTTGTTNSSIQTYIQNAYNTWNPPVEYVLLIGDTNTIPHWVGTGSDTPSTDLYYACVQGTDHIPDVKRGRFPVRSNTQLTNLCDKILDMASNQVKKSAFISGNDYWSKWEQAHDAVIAEHFDPNNWTYDKLYRYTYSANSSDVTNAFNNGRSVGCYRGHGSTTAWSDGPPFYQSSVRALTNTIYPAIWSISCLTNKYSNLECFGETWVVDDHGSTSFFGASVVSYTVENNKLYRQIMDGWFEFGYETLGAMVDYGQYQLYIWMAGTAAFKRSYYEMYNLMGDPAMKHLDAVGSLPTVDIKINGDDGPLNVPHTQTVDITVSLSSGGMAGVAHDWWIFGELNWSNYYWWQPPKRWTLSATPIRSYDGGLFDISNYSITTGKLPAGWWVFTFAIDPLNNTYEGTYIDTIEVQSY